MKSKVTPEKLKGMKIVFPSDSKISEDTHQLVKAMFNIEGALLTNKSMLEDFLDFGGIGRPDQEIWEMFVEKIAEKFGVVIPEILNGETRVWKVAFLINEKQKEILFKKKLHKVKLY